MPLILIDPSGLECVVCGGARIVYRAKIADLDKSYVGTPFRTSADLHLKGVNNELAMKFGITFPELESAGLYFINLKGRRESALHFLFFVVFDICETKDPPGECRLFNDETGTLTKWVFVDDAIKINGGSNQGDVTDESCVKAKRIAPQGRCDKSIIYTDIPGASVEFGAESMSKQLRQKIEVRDSATGMVVASTRNELDFSVDKAGVFTPPPDQTWTVVPKK